MPIELKNFTPFANFHFINEDAQGHELGILIVKTTWDILADGRCASSDEQEPLILADECYGKLNLSSVRYPCELVPFKPQVDFIVNATAFAPEHRAAKHWEVAVTVENPLSRQVVIDKRLSICGPRVWQPKWRGWTLTEPQPITHLDIRYEYSYGGVITQGQDEQGQPLLEAYAYNPIGCGLMDKTHTPDDQPITAPQITDPDQPLTAPFTHYPPMGLGATAPVWLPRRPLGGTYDQAWLDNTWPHWAQDYDFAFHNAAAQGMRCPLTAIPPAPAPGLQMTLTHLHPNIPRWVIQLPNPPLQATLLQQDGLRHYRLQADSFVLDIDHASLSDPRLFIVHRLLFDPVKTQGIVLSADTALATAGRLHPPPTPAQVAMPPAQFNNEA